MLIYYPIKCTYNKKTYHLVNYEKLASYFAFIEVAIIITLEVVVCHCLSWQRLCSSGSLRALINYSHSKIFDGYIGYATLKRNESWLPITPIYY